jgi:hypothetical protein
MKILDNLDYDSLYGGGVFPYVYVIMHQHSSKILGIQKFLYTIWHFFLHDYFFTHVTCTLGATNFKPNGYKKSTKMAHFLCTPFKTNYVIFKNIIKFV